MPISIEISYPSRQSIIYSYLLFRVDKKIVSQVAFLHSIQFPFHFCSGCLANHAMLVNTIRDWFRAVGIKRHSDEYLWDSWESSTVMKTSLSIWIQRLDASATILCLESTHSIWIYYVLAYKSTWNNSRGWKQTCQHFRRCSYNVYHSHGSLCGAMREHR